MHPKSFVSNFWGAVQILEGDFLTGACCLHIPG